MSCAPNSQLSCQPNSIEGDGNVSNNVKKNVGIKFSNQDDEELIEMVSSYEILWKLSHPDYKNNLKKENLWKKIGTALNKSGDQCKSRWRSIRDNFKRHRKSEATGTGQPAKKKRATYWDRLRFLDETEDERKGFTNTEDNDTETGGNDDFVNDVTLFEEVTTEKNEQDNVSASPSVELLEDSIDVQEDCGDTSTLEFKTSTSVKKVKKAKHNPIVEMMKRKEETQGQLMKVIEKLVTPETPVHEDDIDIFLKSIGSTMKQFTPSEKAEAKRKIFNVVSDIELRHQDGGCYTYNYTSPRAMSQNTHSPNSANNK